MYYLYAITMLALAISFTANRQKTLAALKKTFRRLLKVFPAMMLMLMLVSFLPTQLSGGTILRYVNGESKLLSVVSAALLGSIMILPGFIAFPLGGVLLEEGVSYMVISAFTTTLMMVGIISYPLEKAYLGMRATVLRNALSFGIALVVALATGFVFGEL